MDYLTSANYGDGLSNATPSWTYDAAGNRASDSTNSGTWSYDNLNRMTASPNHSYDNDILGNRLSDGPNTTSQQCVWDDLNRMTRLHYGVNNVNDYVYRADGMRVSKTATGSASSQSSTLYRYDGQMGIEDVEKNSSGTITAISRYALGGRGIDAISRTTSSGTALAYPLYDAHGNNVGMLARSGSSWSIADERSYDAWGKVRSGGATGDQKGRYCANLGHKQDDESGLVYMRTRYYESISGRFINQDKAMDGLNWFQYCRNNPVGLVDPSGQVGIGDADTLSQIIKDVLKMFGADLTIPIVAELAMVYASKMVLLYTIDKIGTSVLMIGCYGIGGGGVFTQGPFAAGLAGLCVGIGGIVKLGANFAMIIETYMFVMQMACVTIDEMGWNT